MTDYRLAHNSYMYKQANAFLRENGIEYDRLSFPTIIAYREGEVLGVISTNPKENIIVAGPIFAKTEGNASFIYMRLIEAYDLIIKANRVSGYFFRIWDHQSIWKKQVEKLGLIPYSSADGLTLYRRDV